MCVVVVLAAAIIVGILVDVEVDADTATLELGLEELGTSFQRNLYMRHICGQIESFTSIKRKETLTNHQNLVFEENL
jgi:hypothetical protein